MLALFRICVFIYLFLETIIIDAKPWFAYPQYQRDRNSRSPTSYNSASCHCIDIHDCPAILNLLARKPVSDDILQYIKSSTCGYRGFDPYVCCSGYDTRTRRNPYFNKKSYYDNNYDSNGDFDPENPWHWDYTENEAHENCNHDHHYRNSYPFYHGYGRRHFKPPSVVTAGTKTPEVMATEVAAEVVPETTTTTTTPAPEVTEPAPPPPTVAPPAVDVDTRSTKRSLINQNICGVSINNRIIGGQDAGLGAFPWVARIGYTTGTANRILYRCGGTMINTQYIVTAAHCVTNLPSALQVVSVRLGELDERSTIDCAGTDCAGAPQDFSIARIIPHSGYDTPKFGNDIALIRLDRPANTSVKTFSGYVNPICLPVDQFAPTAETNLTGTAAIVAGWGAMTPDSTVSSPALQWVSLNIEDSNRCAQTYNTRFGITVGEGQLCTQGRTNVDACTGDSGGPLIQESPNERFILTGIVSFGPRRCGTADLPGVYTRLSSYTDWILDNIEP